MWSMIGHDWAVTFLKRHIQSDDIRHAYLIAGAEGLGKKVLALRFARSLNCESGLDLCETDLGESNRCRPCTQIEDLAYPDLHIVRPKTAGGRISVKQVRELERQLHLKPYESQRRTALLFDFHLATHSASNALLKTLEEPPESVVLILTAPTIEALLPTISSRCEILHLRPLARELIRTALEKRGASPDLAGELSDMSAGLPGLALQFLQDEDLRDGRKHWLDDLITLLQSDMATRFAYASSMTEHRDARWTAKQGLELWLGFSRDIMVMSHGADVETVTPDYSESIENLVNLIAPNQIHRFVTDIDEAITAIDQNANPRLAVEHLMLVMPQAQQLI
jgi:DNA polymerase-3 subunit delta'